MAIHKIIKTLDKNKGVFKALLENTSKESYEWKPQADKWCLLEVVCHLRDEEKEDFRARIKHLLTTPEAPMPLFNPVVWVTERKYLEQDFEQTLALFLKERERSIDWLQQLKNPQWNNFYEHSRLGKLSAKTFLSNWLAHDYLHLRQITRLKFQYLAAFSGENLDYAGNW